METFRVYFHDQVHFEGFMYFRWIIGENPERALLSRDGQWFFYIRMWNQPASLVPYVGNVQFIGDNIQLNM